MATDPNCRSEKAWSGRLHVNLAHTPITDLGMVHLAALPNVSYINLRGTQITDAGLKTLVRLNTTLDRLDLVDTQATDEGIRAFWCDSPQGKRILSA
jgi:Leucine Rich repeat